MTVRAIGRHSYIGGGGVITTPVEIGHFTGIAANVRMHERAQHPCARDPLLVASGGKGNLDWYPETIQERGITIGHDVWIGRDAVLMGEISIGHGAIIGAYSVVAKDIPPYAVVVGNPAQIKRFRFDEETIAHLLVIQWWDWPDEVIAERAEDLRDVRALIAKYAYNAPTD